MNFRSRSKERLPHQLLIVGYALVTVLMIYALSSCALLSTSSAPETKLVTGYKTVTAVAKTADILVVQHQLSSKNGQVVVDMSTAAQTALNNGTAQLQACYAAQTTPDATKCTQAVSTIDMASAVLTALSTYLTANNPTGVKP
jgi:hypothetical protein